MAGLHDEPFGYRVTKDGRIRISWRSKTVMTLTGANAARLIASLEDADDAEAQQQLLARATGNFRRGNERPSGAGRSSDRK